MKTTIPITLAAAVIPALMLMAVPQISLASKGSASGFDDTFKTDTATLRLSGVGVLKYLGFIRIYNGALYLPPKVMGEDALMDVPKRLEVEYLRSFKAEDFGAATIAGMRKNVEPETYDRLADRIDAHNRLYPDIRRGDRVSLTYLPGAGTEVAVNGAAMGTIPGADFARALFSLWLGDNPFDDDFKRALRGRR